jgi:hypothetical protein
MGTNDAEVPIETVRITAIRIAIDLPFIFCIFLSSKFYFALSKKLSALAQQSPICKQLIKLLKNG